MAHDEQVHTDGWILYSNWIDDLRDDSDLITECDDDGAFKQGLLACQSNLERFKFIWNNDRLREEVRKCYERELAENKEARQTRIGKDIQESKRMRELGNKSFKDGEYTQALNFYTLAIKHAPYPSQEQSDDALALALANRSAALYSMSRYRSCLLDIDLAIKYGYPEANLFKLFIRKVKCLHILSVWSNDVEEIKSKLRKMEKDPRTKDFIRTEITNMFEFLESSHPEMMDTDDQDAEDELAIKMYNINKFLPQATDCVEMSYHNDKGRYLLANKDISFGRLLMAEEPFVCNLGLSKRNEYCYNCFRRLNSCGLGCKNCTQVLYCSLDCLNANSGIHSYECDGFLDFQEMLGVSYLVAHIMFKINFEFKSIPIHGKKSVEEKSFEEVLQIPSSNWPDLIYKNDYASILSLQDHATDYDYDSMMGYSLTAVYMMEAFIDNFPSIIPTEEEQRLLIGSIVLRHLLQIQTNVISILDQDLQSLALIGHSLKEVEEKPIGVGLYPTISLLNHSCRPNILCLFYKNRFVARASSSIDCGTEINYCYGPSVNRMSKLDRQTRLQEQYFFVCACDCCANDKENECRALVCPKCDGPVIYNRDLTHRCLNCQANDIIQVRDALRRIGELKLELEELSRIKCNDPQKLKDIETDLSKLAYWRNPLFVQIKSQLINCAESNDDHDLALSYCKEELELSDKTYGENSLESIMTTLKYINLDWRRLDKFIEDNSQSQSGKDSSLKQLTKLMSVVQSTRGKLKDLLNSTSVIGAESSFDQELKFLAETYANINNSMRALEKKDVVSSD